MTDFHCYRLSRDATDRAGSIIDVLDPPPGTWTWLVARVADTRKTGWLLTLVVEVLEYVARFKVIRHVRPKAVCTSCHKLVKAGAPERIVARGMASPGLLVQVMASNYRDHLSL